jgi:transcriptional regulator with XRE-family HTH domain
MKARELVAWNVRRLRVARDLSSEALAADAGIDRAYMSEIERGLGNATLDTLDRIAAVLGVDVGEFFVAPEPDEQPPKPLRAGRRKR